MRAIVFVILSLLLAVASNSAMAEWIKIGSSGEGTIIIYADPTTIRKNGNMVKIWTLDDFKTVRVTNIYKYMSEKAQQEYDCNEEQYRLLALVYYSENMGNGEAVYSGSDYSEKWSPVVPGSINELQWEVACGKQ